MAMTNQDLGLGTRNSVWAIGAHMSGEKRFKVPQRDVIECVLFLHHARAFRSDLSRIKMTFKTGYATFTNSRGQKNAPTLHHSYG